MRIKNIRLKSFKRFSDLEIKELPLSAKLIVMTGPNGCGKSSIFDAFRVFHWQNQGDVPFSGDATYYLKDGQAFPPEQWRGMVHVDFHETIPAEPNDRKRMFYLRSAYRNEADFQLASLSTVGSTLDAPKFSRLIDNDVNVSDNYQRLVSASVHGLYSGDFDSINVRALREGYISQIRDSMKRVFSDLCLNGPGDPLKNGSFFFEKGVSKDFHYKNLSAGEKSAFNLILDMCVKREEYSNTVYGIDEPETHMHTRLQSRLLEELYSLVPEGCQLWISTHSIGMMRKAKELQEQFPGTVAFLDFYDRDFDGPIEMTSAEVDRNFWSKALGVALDDLAHLVAPRQVVLCEGRPAGSGKANKAEFDAQCYRTIFGNEFSDTDFISVGNADSVSNEKLDLGKAIQALTSGTSLIRVIDRDDRSEFEISEAASNGVKVLSLRHIESYLLAMMS